MLQEVENNIRLFLLLPENPSKAKTTYCMSCKELHTISGVHFDIETPQNLRLLLYMLQKVSGASFSTSIPLESSAQIASNVYHMCCNKLYTTIDVLRNLSSDYHNVNVLHEVVHNNVGKLRPTPDAISQPPLRH